MKTPDRKWATPLVIAAFIISAVTGILMFFHTGPGLVKPVHEWLSWALVTAAVLHSAVNWKQFLGYFRRMPGMGIVSAGAIVMLFTLLYPGGARSGNPAMKITKALGSASLETVAGVAKLSPEAAIEKLQKHGISVSGTDMSISRIAVQNGKKDITVLGTLFE
jgi:hypothetical protein